MFQKNGSKTQSFQITWERNKGNVEKFINTSKVGNRGCKKAKDNKKKKIDGRGKSQFSIITNYWISTIRVNFLGSMCTYKRDSSTPKLGT